MWNVTTSPLRNVTGVACETVGGVMDPLLPIPGRGDRLRLDRVAVDTDLPDLDQRSVAERVARLDAEAVAVTSEAATDVELADEEARDTHRSQRTVSASVSRSECGGLGPRRDAAVDMSTEVAIGSRTASAQGP